MKFKLSILTILAVLAGSLFPASAQNKDKGFFVELTAGHSNFHDYVIAIGDNSHTIVLPAIGYRFANNWSVGARAQFETEEKWSYESFTTLGVFGQYRFLNLRRFDLFVEAQVMYNSVEHDYYNILITGCGGASTKRDWIDSHRDDFSDSYAEAGFTFGAAYRIWKGLRVTARYLYLGYSGSPYMRRSGACWGDKSMILDAGWNRLQVGLQYTF